MPRFDLPRTKPWSPTTRKTGQIPHGLPTGKKTNRISMSKIHNMPLRSKNQPKSQRIFSRQADYPPSTNHFPRNAPPTATRRKLSRPLPLTSREARAQTGRPSPSSGPCVRLTRTLPRSTIHAPMDQIPRSKPVRSFRGDVRRSSAFSSRSVGHRGRLYYPLGKSNGWWRSLRQADPDRRLLCKVRYAGGRQNRCLPNSTGEKVL